MIDSSTTYSASRTSRGDVTTVKNARRTESQYVNSPCSTFMEELFGNMPHGAFDATGSMAANNTVQAESSFDLSFWTGYEIQPNNPPAVSDLFLPHIDPDLALDPGLLEQPLDFSLMNLDVIDPSLQLECNNYNLPSLDTQMADGATGYVSEIPTQQFPYLLDEQIGLDACDLGGQIAPLGDGTVSLLPLDTHVEAPQGPDYNTSIYPNSQHVIEGSYPEVPELMSSPSIQSIYGSGRSGLFVTTPPESTTSVHMPVDSEEPLVHTSLWGSKQTKPQINLDRKAKRELDPSCDPKLFYTTKFPTPKQWGPMQKDGLPLFVYQPEGQIKPDRLYDRDEFQYYVKNCPRKFVAWVQQAPAQCNHRLMIWDRKCRYKHCPDAKRSILPGWLRVAFDEYSQETSKGSRDPFKVAMAMHLWCFEQCFDPSELYVQGALIAEDRKLPREPKNAMTLTKNSDALIVSEAFIPWFADRQTDYILNGPKVPGACKYEDTLSYALVSYHLDKQIQSRQRTRASRNAVKSSSDWNTIDIHKGNLELFASRGKARNNRAREKAMTNAEEAARETLKLTRRRKKPVPLPEILEFSFSQPTSQPVSQPVSQPLALQPVSQPANGLIFPQRTMLKRNRDEDADISPSTRYPKRKRSLAV